MIKVFRKIRRKVISESKYYKYVIYAIGEILLVVIGILIALQVNNWNEARKSSEKKILLLEKIKADYTSNANRLLAASNKSVEINRKMIHLMQLLSNDSQPIPKDTILKYSSELINITRFTPVNSAYLTAQSTGDIGLIADEYLLELFIDFQEANDWLDFHVKLSGDMVYSGSIWEMRKKLGSLYVILPFNDNPVPDSYRKREDEFEAFFRQKEVYAVIESTFWIYRNVDESLKEMIEVNERILVRIEKLLGH